MKNERTAILRGRLSPGTAALAAIVYGLTAASAGALEPREVERVVTVLEQLASETGDTVFYDEEAAEEWFQIDDESSQRIPAAGFTRESWKEAFDQTMTGFIASIPEADMEGMAEEFVNKIGEIGQLTPQQKQEAIDAFRAEFWKFDEIRDRGAQYVDVVGPYAQRLRKITLQQ